MVAINTQKERIYNDCNHDDVFESLGLDYFEALQSETVNGFNGNNLRIGMH